MAYIVEIVLEFLRIFQNVSISIQSKVRMALEQLNNYLMLILSLLMFGIQ